VLHVDDDSSIRKLVARVLGTAGMVVDGVGSAREVDAMLARSDYDVVIVDRHIGCDDGLELIARLRASDPDLSLLMFSGSIDPEVVARAEALGVVRCVDKVGPLRTLVDAVRVAAGRSGTIQIRDAIGSAAASGTDDR